MNINSNIDVFDFNNGLFKIDGWVVYMNDEGFSPSCEHEYFIGSKKLIPGVDIDFLMRHDVIESLRLNSKMSEEINDETTKMVGFSIRTKITNHDSSDFCIFISGESYYPPLSQNTMQIELAGECNLKCVMCPQAFNIYNNNLKKEDIDAILENSNTYSHFELNHQGETLLSPHLDYFLKKIGKNKTAFFNTNGFLLNKKNMAIIFENAPPIRLIRFSIDGADDTTFKKIRGGNLSTLKRKIYDFYTQNKKLGHHKIKLSIGAIVMRENFKNIHLLIDFAKSIESDIEFWPLCNESLHGGDEWKIQKTDWVFNYKENILNAAEWNEFRLNAKNYSIYKNVQVAFPEELVANSTPVNNVSSCDLFFNHVHFNGGGRAQICCHQTSEIYNWKIDGTDFLNHPRVVKIRELAKNNIIPKECAGARCGYVNGLASTEDGSNSYHPGKGIWMKRKYI